MPGSTVHTASKHRTVMFVDASITDKDGRACHYCTYYCTVYTLQSTVCTVVAKKLYLYTTPHLLQQGGKPECPSSKYSASFISQLRLLCTWYDIILEISAFYCPVLVAEDHHTIDPSKFELQCVLIVQTYWNPFAAS